MRQPSMKLMMKRLCEKAGVTPFGFHAIRHYFAVCLVKSQKADITDIQQLLGHQRPTTTDIYLRSVAPNLDRLAGVIEGAVQSVAVPGDEAEADG
ncbi:tyrosine-type recombinase/integrase [Desulfovibrio sp.]|uniref:tyrosine-type recombinase/integrase n=1 Tax=Desulfovibrio sp. TaxID=885 RepID=UPI0039C87C27